MRDGLTNMSKSDGTDGAITEVIIVFLDRMHRVQLLMVMVWRFVVCYSGSE